MFPSRVLPPPVPTLAPAADDFGDSFSGSRYISSLGSKPDALLDHRINMTGENSQAAIGPRASSPTPSYRDRAADERLSPGSDKLSVGTEGSTRKHQLSQTEETLPKDRQLSSISTNLESPSQICLCQPDPKVPRPRNAFILYRQHFQAKVVNENPGLANPDISKIIGDQWRNSPPEIKAHWKSLAEEEKLRHQRQYPDYRYQPKRGRNSIATTALQPGQTSPRCQKCGGKSMATPTHAPSPNFRAPPPPPPESPVAHYPHPQSVLMPPRTPYGIPGGQYMNMSPIHPSFLQRPMPTGSRHLDRVNPGDYPMSPDAKRRRYESPVPNNTRYGDNSTRRPLPPGAIPPQSGPGDRLPRPEFMKGSPGFTIAPAPPGSRVASTNNNARPNGPNSNETGTGNPRHDSLTLAPLKIDRSAHLRSPSTTSASAAQSVAAMVMSIKPLHKIRTLQRISLPLQKPNPTSPPYPVRGALISVEYSEDRASGELVANAIRDDLTRNNEHVTRAFEPPALEMYGRQAEESDVLKLMDCWHGVSREIVKYITTVPDSEEQKALDASPVSPKTTWPKLARGQQQNPTNTSPSTRRSKRKVPDTYPDAESSVPATSPVDTLVAAASTTSTSSSPPPQSHPVPIALVPNYQLTATDTAACRVPIIDEYSPLDHWRWVAALWRGTVGPDVTIAIRGPEEEAAVEKSPVPMTAGGNGPATGMGRGGSGQKMNVEIRLEECRTVIVRTERKGEVSEQVLRRVAFEVGEWLRGREERERR